MIDLDAYFQRIGYRGERSATLRTLRELHRLHTQSIAFENLNPLLGWEVSLDPKDVWQKLIHDGRGGYCFEQNLIFSGVLRQLGFDVLDIAARVLMDMPQDVMTARTHRLLRVIVEGVPYVADVGFGGQTVTGPLRIESDVEQATPHEPYRLLKHGDAYDMQAFVNGHWKTLYRFDFVEQLAVDYELSNYFTSTNPASVFVRSLTVARPDVDRRHSLYGNRYSVYPTDGATPERRNLSSVREICDVLETVFNLKLPNGPALEARLARLLRESSPG